MATSSHLILNTTHSPQINVVCDAVRSKQGSPIQDSAFSGVPIMCLINIICFFIIILIFGILRKYLYFDELKNDTSSSNSNLNNSNESINSTSNYRSFDTNYNNINSSTIELTGNLSHRSPNNDSFFSFITNTIHINDSQIQSKCGSSAVQYLRFQRFIFYLMFLITILSLVVILPANLSGTLYKNNYAFARTTIANLTPGSTLIWLHSIAAIIYVVIGVRLMSEFKRSTLDSGAFNGIMTSKVLMFTDIPPNNHKLLKDYKLEIISHLETAYYGCKVEFVQFAFDYKSAIEEYDKIIEKETLINLCSNEDQKAEFTNNYQVLLRSFLGKLDNVVDNKRLPLIFVKVNNKSQANRIYRDFSQGLGIPSQSPMYLRLKVEQWSVERCPIPDDIFWLNLSQTLSSYHMLRTILINVLLFIIVIFFTTPTILLSNIQSISDMMKINITRTSGIYLFSWVSSFLPTIMLLAFSQLLPLAVSSLSIMEGHLTISGCNRICMQRTFWFLICMVTIFPSIGLGSLDIFLERSLRNATASSVTDEAMRRFKCIFLPSNGAFFVNYVITSAFIGNSCELLRLAEFIYFIYRRCFAKTQADKQILKQERAFEFQYSMHYAWMLTIVATTVAFSIVCPVITPFGLAYLFIKHYVDKYNLYYAFKQSNLDIECHKSAIRYVLFSLYLLFFTVFFFTIMRTDTTFGWFDGFKKSPQAIFLTVVFITVIVAKMCLKLMVKEHKDMDNSIFFEEENSIGETDKQIRNKSKNQPKNTQNKIKNNRNTSNSDENILNLSSNGPVDNIDINPPNTSTPCHSVQNNNQTNESSSFSKPKLANQKSSAHSIPLKYDTMHRNNKYLPKNVYHFLYLNNNVNNKNNFLAKLGFVKYEVEGFHDGQGSS